MKSQPFRLNRFLWCFALALGLLAGGCDSAQSPTSSDATAPAVQSTKEDTSADHASNGHASNIDAEVISVQQFEQIIDQHLGDVVLVDFWATWCTPCKEQFPHTVALHNQFEDQGLTVISMSLDYPEDKEQIVQFLRKSDATFENYISELGGGAASVEAFELDAGVPHYRLYDRSGELRYRINGDPQEGNLDQHLEELLAEGSTEQRAES